VRVIKISVRQKMFEVIVIIIAGISLRHRVDIFCQRLDALELLG